MAFTTSQYVQTDPEGDRQAANTLTELVITGSLAPVEVTHKARDGGTDEAAWPTRARNARLQLHLGEVS